MEAQQMTGAVEIVGAQNPTPTDRIAIEISEFGSISSHMSLRFAFLSMCVSLLSACGGMGFGLPGGKKFKPQPPTASVHAAVLATHPKEKQVVRYLCPKVAPSLACRLLGAQVNVEDLRFAFDFEIDIHNPNSIPIPMVELAASFTAYPEMKNANNLGSVCLKLCPEGQSCQSDGGGCESGDELRNTADYANAAANFLIGVATGANGVDNLRVRMLEAKQSTRVVVRFELRPEQILGLVENASSDLLKKAVSGKSIDIAIPFAIQGTAYLNIEGFGRMAVDVPRFDSEWEL